MEQGDDKEVEEDDNHENTDTNYGRWMNYTLRCSGTARRFVLLLRSTSPGRLRLPPPRLRLPSLPFILMCKSSLATMMISMVLKSTMGREKVTVLLIVTVTTKTALLSA